MKKLSIKVIEVVAVLFILTSCNHQTKIPNGRNEIIVETPEGRSLMLSDFCSDVDYLKLDYNDSSIIGKIEKVVIQDEKIFILDPDIKKIAIFSLDGKYVGQINKFGRGPGEYLSIQDFLVDSLNKIIEIKDSGNRKILKYDYKGNFLSERSLKLYATNFCKLSPDIYVYFACNYLNIELYGKDSYNAIVLDSNNKLINSFLPIKKFKYFRMHNTNCFVKYNNGINVSIPFDNYIYHITANECIAKYKISFINYAVPENLFNDYDKIDQADRLAISNEGRQILLEVNSNHYATGVHNVFENRKILFFQYSVPSIGLYTVIFNKNTKKTYVGIPENDIDFGIFGEPIALLNDTLITYIYPYDLSAKIKSLELSKTYDSTNQKLIKLKKMSELLKETGNPVIAKFVLSDL